MAKHRDYNPHPWATSTGASGYPPGYSEDGYTSNWQGAGALFAAALFMGSIFGILAYFRP